ncbi:MAG: cell division protein SepF [Clostridia bacterium]|nr:cell division protein SepF [Clostridia bacterium]
MASVSDIFYRVRQRANGFLHGRPNLGPRTSYYTDGEDTQYYENTGNQTDPGYANTYPPQPPYPPQQAYQGAPGYAQQAYQGSAGYPPQPNTRQGTQPPPAYRTQAGFQERSVGPEPSFQGSQAESNFSYFPGAQAEGVEPQNIMYTQHVSHMMTPADIHKLVEFVRVGEPLIVNCESIPNAQEVQRCIDLLTGAAITSGCVITRLSVTAKVLLISPAAIRVDCDEASNRMNGRNADGSPLRSRGQGGLRRAPKQVEGADYHAYNRPGRSPDYRDFGQAGDAPGYYDSGRDMDYPEYREDASVDYAEHREEPSDMEYQPQRRSYSSRPTYYSAAR